MSVPENPCPLTIEMSDPRLGATMIRVNIPRLVSRRIGGKTYYTWQPTKVVKALERVVGTGDLGAVEGAIVDLVSQLRQHIKEERHLFTTLFIAARGSEA